MSHGHLETKECGWFFTEWKNMQQLDIKLVSSELSYAAGDIINCNVFNNTRYYPAVTTG
jgi:hypothetical protein